MNAKVSVIVPIRNEEEHIAQTLKCLLEQDREGIEVEILVIDGRSTDRTRAIVKELAEQHAQIALLDNPERLSSAARNVGVQNARGDYLLVIDGHCEIRSRTYFRDMVEAFERTGADCLGRPQPLDVTNATSFQQAVAAARNSPLGHHPDSFIYSNQEIKVPAISVAVAYRASVFENVGLFDSRFDACEDCELNYRIDQAGLICYLVPELAIHYQPRKSIRALFKQLTRYGRGRIQLARKHAGTLKFTTILPALFSAGVILGPLVCGLVPAFWYFYWAVITSYMLAVLYYSLQAFSTSDDRTKLWWLPVVFFTIHQGSAWGILKETIYGCFGNSETRHQVETSRVFSEKQYQ